MDRLVEIAKTAPKINSELIPIWNKINKQPVKIAVAYDEVFNFYYKDLNKKEFMSIYRERSNLIGKAVSFLKGNEEITATVLDIDDDARLIVKTNNETLALFAGEVSVKIKDLF